MNNRYIPFRRCLALKFAPVINESNNIAPMPPGPYEVLAEWWEAPEVKQEEKETR